MKQLFSSLCIVAFVVLSGHVKAQKLKVTCETEGVTFRSAWGKEVSSPIDVFLGYQALTVEKKGFRSITKILKVTSGLVKSGYSFPELEPYPRFEALNKYFILDKSELNLKEGDMEYSLYLRDKLQEKSKVYYSDKNSEALAIRSYGLSDHLNFELKQFGLIDTSDSFFPDYSNSLMLDCSIEKIFIEENYERGQVQISLEVNWKVKDFFNVELIRISTSAKSNTMASNQGIITYMNDALQDGLIQLLRNEELAKAVKERDTEIESVTAKEPVLLSRPTNKGKALEDVLTSVVTIERKDGHGSGCIISPDGYVITNYHVSGKGGDSLTVITSTGEHIPAVLERFDPVYDLALLRIEKTGLPSIMPDQMNISGIGDVVFAIGTPADPSLGQSVTKGIVSAKRDVNNREYFQTDAQVNPGNSGGAFVSSNGQLIGIISSKALGYSVTGVGFAIPSHYIYDRLRISYR